MMKSKMMTIVALTVALIAAANTASASAVFTLSENKCSEGKFGICWDSVTKGTNLRELIGEETYETKQLGTAKLSTKFGKSSVEISCTSTSTTEGLILLVEPLIKPILLHLVLRFFGCKSVAPANCTAPAEISTGAVIGEAVNQTNVAEGVAFRPETGETFTKIKYTGAECLLKGEQAVKGSQICKFPTAGETLKGQELKCEPSGSKLFFGAEAAKAELTLNLSMTIPTLEATSPWDLALS